MPNELRLAWSEVKLRALSDDDLVAHALRAAGENNEFDNRSELTSLREELKRRLRAAKKGAP